jgi:response regulator RpfG family c-di-GMP phosphodiesterase
METVNSNAKGNMGQDEFDLLIVEDDNEILHLLMELFSDQSLRIQGASNVTQAKAMLGRFDFRILLTDHNLPDGNGVDLLAELAGSGSKAVPILMTGVTDLNVAVEAINRGKVFKFVSKPLDFQALIQTVLRAGDYYDAQREHERLTHDIIEHNEMLLREAEGRERRLMQAAERIHAEEAKVERQKAHIESLYSEIQQAYLHTVTSLTLAIEAKDRYTKGHSERVFYYCSLMADVLGLHESSWNDLRFASVLHDLGKIGIPDSILRKPGALLPEEWQVMQSHPTLTADILKPLPFLENVRKIIREHHERIDGSGYPEGLKGSQISLEGRILAVADSYDAMRSDRAYRRALNQNDALDELKKSAGSSLCPLCVGALVYALESHGECAAATGVSGAEKPWEEEYTKLRPASETVMVESLLN